MGLGALNPGCNSNCVSNCGRCFGSLSYSNCLISWTTSGNAHVVQLVIDSDVVSLAESGQMIVNSSMRGRTVLLRLICEAGGEVETIGTLVLPDICAGGGGGGVCCNLGDFIQIFAEGDPWDAFSGLYQWNTRSPCARLLSYNINSSSVCSNIITNGTYIGKIRVSPSQEYDAIALPFSILVNPGSTIELIRLNFSLSMVLALKAPGASSYSCNGIPGLTVHHRAAASCSGGYCADNYPCSTPFYRPIDFIYRFSFAGSSQYSNSPFGTTAELTSLSVAIGQL